MPILYIFGIAFYFVLYWVYKLLLLKFYQRTNKFNEELPIKSVSYMKIGIILHMVVGSILLTNTDVIPKSEDGFSLVNEIKTWDFYKKNKNDFVANFMERYGHQNHGLVYVMATIVILSLIVIFNVIKLLIALIKSCCAFRKSLKSSEGVEG